MDSVTLLPGNCLDVLPALPAQSVHCVVTSPPYFGLRAYNGGEQEIGSEATPDAYVARLVAVFREVWRVLRDDGTCWLNLGDSYAGSGNGSNDYRPEGASISRHSGKYVGQKPRSSLASKQLLGIPWRVAFALQADGWYLRQDIIWHKPNPMPESVRDRCTKAHEYIFLLSKGPKYYFDAEAIKEPVSPDMLRRAKAGHTRGQGKLDKSRNDAATVRPTNITGTTRNRRSVWTVTTKPFKGAHFATFPPDLIRPCILAGCHPKGRRCDCDEVIASPTGSGPIEDPTMQTGRAGMNRTRRDDEGTRPITRREQRHEAIEMKASPHRQEMERECGPAFAHYIRTDRSGARPLPNDIRKKYMEAGWITEAPPCTHPIEEAGTVLDPFGGSGTTALVALEEGRNAVLCELNPDYIALAHKRLEGLQLRIA